MGCFSSKVIPEGGFVDDEFPDAAAIGRIGDHHPKRKYLEAAVWRWGFELMPGAVYVNSLAELPQRGPQL